MSIQTLTGSGTLTLALLAALALGDRATEVLDPIESAMQAAEQTYADDTSKTGKQRLKAATKALKKLAKDSDSEAGDAKTLSKIDALILKRFGDDTDVVAALEMAADAFEASIVSDLEQASGRLPPTKKKPTPAKVTKLIAKAQKQLDKSRAKTKLTARISKLVKARVAADKALAAALELETEAPVTQRYDFTSFLVAPGNGGPRLFGEGPDDASPVEIASGTGDVQIADPLPARSPDGSHTAFQQGSRLLLMPLDDATGIVDPGVDGDWERTAWSNDSALLAASATGPDTLLVTNRSGATIHSKAELVITSGIPEQECLLWSPDGASLAFRTDRDTNSVREVQVLDIATGTVTEVSSTNLTTDAIRFVAWSSVSAKLVYVANENRADSAAEVVVVGADGTGRMAISPAGQDVRDSMSTSSIRMSPTAEMVLYEYRENSAGHLATVALDGTNPNTIATASANFFGQFEWSPDGTRIAYLDDGALHTCAPDGSDNVTVTATCPDFQWTPDGSGLVYRVGTGGSFGNDLFRCDPDGTNQVEIAAALLGGHNVEPHYACSLTDNGDILVTFLANPGTGAVPFVAYLRPATVGKITSEDLAAGLIDRLNNADDESSILPPAGFLAEALDVESFRVADGIGQLRDSATITITYYNSQKDEWLKIAYLVYRDERINESSIYVDDVRAIPCPDGEPKFVGSNVVLHLEGPPRSRR